MPEAPAGAGAPKRRLQADNDRDLQDATKGPSKIAKSGADDAPAAPKAVANAPAAPEAVASAPAAPEAVASAPAAPEAVASAPAAPEAGAGMAVGEAAAAAAGPGPASAAAAAAAAAEAESLQELRAMCGRSARLAPLLPDLNALEGAAMDDKTLCSLLKLILPVVEDKRGQDADTKEVARLLVNRARTTLQAVASADFTRACMVASALDPLRPCATLPELLGYAPEQISAQQFAAASSLVQPRSPLSPDTTSLLVRAFNARTSKKFMSTVHDKELLGHMLVGLLQRQLEAHTFGSQSGLDQERGSMIAPILDHFVLLGDAGKVTQADAAAFILLCSKLKVVPVALLVRLKQPCAWCRAKGFTTLREVRDVLRAFALLGCGKHRAADQKGIRQPHEFLRELALHAASLLPARLEDSDTPWLCRSLSWAITYINVWDKEVKRCVIKLLNLGGDTSSIFNRPPHRNSHPDVITRWVSSWHQLWQAYMAARQQPVNWLSTSELAREFDVSEVLWARKATINAGTEPSVGQQEMQELLGDMSRHGYSRQFAWVSRCEAPLPEIDWLVDVLVISKKGLKLIYEFDDPQHRLAPHGSLSGSSLWRNWMLRQLGYHVLMVDSTKWEALRGDEAGRRKLLVDVISDELWAKL